MYNNDNSNDEITNVDIDVIMHISASYELSTSSLSS